MSCVRGRWWEGALRGRVALLLLVLTMESRVSSGEPDVIRAQDCVMYTLQENGPSLVLPFSGKEIILSIESESSNILCGLVLELKSELGSLRATFNDSTEMVQCHNDSHTSHGQEVFYHPRHTGKLFHVTFAVKNHLLCIDNSPVCDGSEIHGSNLNLTVQSYTGSSHIVFNCEHGCPIIDDAAIISLECLPRNKQVYVTNASADATATLRLLPSCNTSDGINDDQPKEMNVKASALNGLWSPLLFNNIKGMIKKDMKTIIALTVGNMTDIFFTSSNRSRLKVVNSNNMFWTVECDPRKQVKVDHSTAGESLAENTTTDTEFSCDVGYWKVKAVFLMLIVFVLLSFIAVIFICRHFKKWKKSVGDNNSHFLESKSEQSEEIQTPELRTSQSSCATNVLPPNSNSTYNDCNDVMSKHFSKDEKNIYPMMFPPPPSSPPPLPDEIQASMFPLSVESLDSTAQDPNNDEDDDEHDYDYMNIDLLQQQLDKDKEEKERKELEVQDTKMEEQRRSETEAKVKLCHHDSINSLYESLNTVVVGRTSVNEN